jgi:hypothetical protein
VEQRLDGSVWARVGDQTIELKVCERREREIPQQPAGPARKDHNRGGRSLWMKDFDLSKSLPIRQPTQIADQTG